jgi:hypothetical protein
LRRASPADNENVMEGDERFNRRSVRLKGYDYTRDGAYFVTVCIQGREHAFGAVVNGEMRPNECGREVARCWRWLAEQYPSVYLDEWIVMPDHTHAIIVITDANEDDAHPNVAILNDLHSNPVGAVREPPKYVSPLLRDPWYGQPTKCTPSRRNANRWDV